VSEGLSQGPYVAARAGFEPATLRTQGNELSTEPLRPIFSARYTSMSQKGFVYRVGEIFGGYLLCLYQTNML